MNEPNQNGQYFAVREPTYVADYMSARAATFWEQSETFGYLDTIRRSWLAYYGLDSATNGDTHVIQFTGDQGELTSVKVNHFRSIAQHMYTMITANRPTMEAQAINTDYKSLVQTYLANSILEYYMRQKNLEKVINRAAEMAITMGSAYVQLAWNSEEGEEYDYDEESDTFNYTGDVTFTNLSPFDVIFDGTKESYDNDWLLVRTFKNKYALMAKYPEHADEIRGLPTKSDNSIYRFSMFSNDKTDDVPVYEFYHKRSAAVPKGRYILYLANNITLLDTKLPYRSIPIYRIVPNEILGTPYGYTPMFDIYAIQQAIDSLYSTILTNQNAFGVQNVFVPHNADLIEASLPGGLNIVKGNAKPEPINLTATPKEIFDFLEIMIKSAETISGVNSVTRGAPEASLKSGTALALVQSMALQFISGLQQSYVKLIEDVGTNLITILKDFAATPRVIAVVGKNNRSMLKEFTGEDINAVSRVIVNVGNPLAKSVGGRIQMVQEMTQMGLITDPQQYLQILNTGNLSVAYEGEMEELLNIKKENEMLLETQKPLVSPLDNHVQHINEHKSVINDPELRQDPAFIKNLMDHIEDHLNALRNTDPQLLMVTKQQPLPPELPPGMGPPPGQPTPMPPGNNIPQAPQKEMAAMNKPIQGVQGPDKGPGMPNVPKPPAPFQHLPTNPSETPNG